MNPSLSLSRIVAVSVALTAAGAQAQSLSNMLIMGSSSVIDLTERYRSYTDLTEVATDFGTTTVEYLAAQRWFSQAPQPTEVLIGRWANTAASGGLRGATLSAAQKAMSVFTAITNGGFKYLKDGGAAVNVTGLNFSAAANLNAVAGIIQAALTGVTCVWNANYSRFEFQSTTTGPTSAVGFLIAPTAGTDISATLGAASTSSGAYLYVGQAAETAVAAAQLMDALLGQRWYGINFPIPASSNDAAMTADRLAVSAYIEGTATKHTHWVTSSDAGTLVSSNTTCLAYQYSQLNYRRTFLQYSSSDANAAVSAAGRLLTVDYTGNATAITLKFKTEPGIVAEYLNSNQADAAEAFAANIFVNYNNDTAIIEQGVMTDGTFADIVTGTDWLAVTIQTAIYNLLYTSPTKIPQTNAGQALVNATAEKICLQGVLNGLLAPGTWNAQGFGLLAQGDYMPKGYYVYSASVDTQLESDRASRLAMPIQIAAKLAGAIHHVNVAITVNQ